MCYEIFAYLQGRIPTTCTQRRPIRAHADATDTIVVSLQYAHSLAFQGVPDVARPVVISAKQDTTGDGESDRRDGTEDVVVDVAVELTVSAKVEEAAGGVIRPGGEGISIGEEAVEE